MPGETKRAMSNEDRIARLEHVVGTLITWLPRELGRSGVQELLDMLVSPKPEGSES